MAHKFNFHKTKLLSHPVPDNSFNLTEIKNKLYLLSAIYRSHYNITYI